MQEQRKGEERERGKGGRTVFNLYLCREGRLRELFFSPQPSTSHSYTYLDPSLLLLAAPLPKGISLVVTEGGGSALILFASPKFKIPHPDRDTHFQVTGPPLKLELSSQVRLVARVAASPSASTFNNIKVGPV